MDLHEEFRELAALRLYGELDAAELERLERHLAQCSVCSALARELEGGLARLVPAAVGNDLPSGWKHGLEAALVAGGEPPPNAVPRSTLWTAAASFLVGAGVAWSVAEKRTDPAVGPQRQVATTASEAAFERSSPPPRARDTASLPPLAELYLTR